MKTSILILTAIACASIARAQTINVAEQKTKFVAGEKSALVVTVFQNSKDDVVSKWKSYLKDFKNEKVKYDNDELFADNVLIKEWGNNTADIYTRFEENKTEKTVKMVVAFDLGGAYLTREGDGIKYPVAEKMLKDFAIKTTREAYDERIKNAQKVLNNLDADQKNLEKENKSLHDDIETYKSKITKAEEDIKTNEANQAKKKSETDEQKIAVELLKRQMEGVN